MPDIAAMVDCSTGEVTIVALTADEVASRASIAPPPDPIAEMQATIDALLDALGGSDG